MPEIKHVDYDARAAALDDPAAVPDLGAPPDDPAPPIEAYAGELTRGTARSNGNGAAQADEVVAVTDFYAYMPMHQYLFVPTRELWPGSSVNAKCATPCDDNGQALTKLVQRKGKGGVKTFESVPVSAVEYLDAQRTVEQMTWAPGEPMLVRDRLVVGGGWIERAGCSCFNLYLPPRPLHGEAAEATQWLDHTRRVFPEHANHIVNWLAHRVQRPGEKINHALVLSGAQGIGKDSILEPLRYAIGPWNFVEVTPLQSRRPLQRLC